MSPNLPLTPAQEQVLAHIAAGATVTTAARIAGVHRNTIGNWLRSSPAFHDALEQAHHCQALFWREHSEVLASNAFNCLEEIIDDKRANVNARIKASLAIIQLAGSPLKPCPHPPAPDAAPPAAPALEPCSQPPAPADPPGAAPTQPENVHKSAQSLPEKPSPAHLVAPPSASPNPKTGRNDACPCGSGKKFKRCCLGKSPAVAGPALKAVA